MPSSQTAQAPRSGEILKQNIKAMFIEIEHDTALWAALLVFFGALFLLLAFPFYPLLLAAGLAAVCGGIAYKFPGIAVVLSLVLAFPTIAYQSPILAWLFLIPFSLSLFYIVNEWPIIAFLETVVLAPFAPFPFSLLSPFIYLAMGMAALYVGSKRSISISIPSVFAILLLSSFWTTQNAAFLPIRAGEYKGESVFSHSSLPELEFSQVVPGALNAISSLMNPGNFQYAALAMETLFKNTLALFIYDTALYQLAFWAIILFLISYIPGHLHKSKRKQLIASLPLLLVPVFYFALSSTQGIPFNFLMFPYSIASILVLGAIEQFDIKLAREAKLQRAEKTKQFGKFGIQDMAESEGAQSLNDIGGYEDVKSELREAIVTPLEQKGVSLKYGIKPPSGVLLFGPPGTGKTLLMRALSKELSYGFYYIKCSDLLSQWYGESEKNLSEVFSIARKNAPCILFFDEIDSIGKKRTGYSSDDVGPRLLSLFLEELDGFKTKKNVITIGATNLPNQLDPALMRPGRLDKIIYMHLPDFEARKEIFKVHSRKLPLAQDIDFDRLASTTERFSGADIGNVCSEAARLAAREAVKSSTLPPVSMSNFTTVLSQVRPSVSLEALSDYEKFKLDFERRVVSEKKKEKKSDVEWEQVAGLEDVKRSLKEAIELPLMHEDLLKQYKIKPSKGLLMFGPPGCGKTMIAKAAANKLSATFLTLSGAELTKKGYEYSVQVIKETFNRAREQAPSIIFIDEIESMAPAGGSYSSRPLVSQLLTELDGVSEIKNVMLVGATNKPYMLDPAILRPGRFDKIIMVPPPDLPARVQIFKDGVSEFMDGAREKDFMVLGSLTEGFSGADIASICQEAKMQVVRKRLKGGAGAVLSEDIAKIIKSRKPSITPTQMQEFDRFMSEYGERK